MCCFNQTKFTRRSTKNSVTVCNLQHTPSAILPNEPTNAILPWPDTHTQPPLTVMPLPAFFFKKSISLTSQSLNSEPSSSTSTLASLGDSSGQR